MTMDVTVVLGAFGGMLLGFYGIARIMLKQASDDRDADRQERKELSKGIKDMAGATGRNADASLKVAEATTHAAAEAKERNGHLGEQNVHIAELAANGNKMLKQLLDQALKTASIAAEDRDVLTNSNKHIASEVDKRMNKEVING